MYGIWDKTCECWVRLKGCDFALPNWLEGEIADSIMCYETAEKADKARIFCFGRIANSHEVRVFNLSKLS